MSHDAAIAAGLELEALTSPVSLEGLAVPFYVVASDDGSGRIVRLPGSGNSDYLDTLVEPGPEHAVVALAFRHLEARRGHRDRCDLLELRPESLQGRPATEHRAEHWRQHRPALYGRVGIAPPEARTT